MGIADAFNKEDRVEVKYTDFYRIIKEATKAELVMNAVNCKVPHQHIREMATGAAEETKEERILKIGRGFEAAVCSVKTEGREMARVLQSEATTWDDIAATNQELPDMNRWDCVGGVDYEKTNSFVGCVLLFKRNGKYYVIQHTFVCAKSRDLPGIEAPLAEWADKGDLEFVNDVEIPPEKITEWFAQMGRIYHIKKIAIDDYRYSLLNSAFKDIGFDAFEKKNIKLTRPSDIMKASPVINSVFANHNFVWGDLPVMRWYARNTKKVFQGTNISYGKIEPNYRKTDGFMALVAAMTIEDEIQR